MGWFLKQQNPYQKVGAIAKDSMQTSASAVLPRMPYTRRGIERLNFNGKPPSSGMKASPHPSRRHFLSTLSGAAAAGIVGSPQVNAAEEVVIGHGSRRFKVLPQWGKLDAGKYPIVNCHAMVQTKDGLLHTLCDGVRNNFLIYDKSGNLVHSWGTEYPGAHGLEVFDENGEEFFYIADGGWMVRGDDGKASREQGRVSKITTEGKHVFTLGHPVTVGAYEPGEPFQPCDIAVAPTGDVYVADGYGSNWVLQYDHNGKYIRRFGGALDPNPQARLKSSHGISIDNRDPENPKLVVSSRSEQKLKWFTLAGEYLFELALPGAYAGQCVFHQGHGYAGVCWSKDPDTGKRSKSSGFVTIIDDNNKVVSNPGGSAPVYDKEGQLQSMYQVGDWFQHVHDVCVDDEGSLYALQWNSKGAYPIKMVPV